jgi:hypothetical protein
MQMKKSRWTSKLFWFSIRATILGLGLLPKVSTFGGRVALAEAAGSEKFKG